MSSVICLIWTSLKFCCLEMLNGCHFSESIRGKNILVTGASTGIGEQIAYHYARLGANVVITARRESRLKQVLCYAVLVLLYLNG